MTTVKTVIFSGKTSIGKALQRALGPLGGFSVVLDDQCPRARERTQDQDVDVRLGLAIIWDEWEFFDYMARFGSAHVDGVVVVLPLWREEKPWSCFRDPRQRKAFRECCRCVRLDIPEIIGAITTLAAERKGMIGLPTRTVSAAHARNLLPVLNSLSHGGSRDVSNALLGPLRMLRLAGPQHVAFAADQKDWRKFADDAWNEMCRVRNGLQKKVGRQWNYGDLGHELLDVMTTLSGAGEKPVGIAAGSGVMAACVEDIERFMLLMSAIRQEAGGAAPDASTRLPCPPPLHIANVKKQGDHGDNQVYRVLVIDDYAVSWRPVLKVAGEILLEGGVDAATPGRLPGLVFEFSIDGKVVETKDRGPQPIGRLIGDYDLVLLDIFLPNSDGIEILSRIRSLFHSLPVILWTTSLDPRFPVKASLANGFLQKKSTDCRMLAEVIGHWLEQGRARRTTSLLNPFFDHMVRTHELRQCARAFTDWCMKSMDAFHALDDRYFKFFNDHGGRHVLGVLNNLEKLIRPLLWNQQVFSADAAERELQIWHLYIAALCHDLGMFPMAMTSKLRTRDGITIEQSEERFERFSISQLKQVRKLHGVRSLLVVYEKDYGSKKFRELKKKLSAAPGASIAVTAMLAAGHNAAFDTGDQFFSLTATGKKDLESACLEEGSGRAVGIWPRMRKDTYRIVEDLKGVLSKMPPAQKDQLRRHCALMRLADALDVDESRAPADFLLHNDARSVFDDWENLKRQVVETVTIDRGQISLRLKAVRPLEGDLAALKDLSSIPGWRDRAKRGVLSGDDDDLLRLLAGFEYPWSNLNVSEEIVDVSWDWAHAFFSWPDRVGTDMKLVAALAGLSVAAEIHCDYQAAVSAGLGNELKLDNVEWRSSADWVQEKLTVLQRVDVDPKKLIGEGFDLLGLCTESKFALEKALDDLFRSVDPFPTLSFRPIGSGHTDAVTFLVEPTGYQPRFCKVDKFESIRREYEGYFSHACLRLPPDNLISDVRIAKYRDRGILIGTNVGASHGEEVQSLETFCREHPVAAKLQVKSLFHNVVIPYLLRPSADWRRRKATDVYAAAIKKIGARWSEFSGGIDRVHAFLNGGRGGAGIDEDVIDKWEDFGDKWEAFQKSLHDTNLQLDEGFCHGDFHCGNIMYLPERRGGRRFVIIDTADCGPGHVMADLAAFTVSVETRVSEHLIGKGKNASVALKSACGIGRVAENACREKCAEFTAQYATARAMRLFQLLVFWPSDFDGPVINDILLHAWKSLDDSLKLLGVHV